MSTKTTKNNKQLTTMKSDSAIVKNLSKEEIAKSQESAVTRYHSFSDSFKAIIEKRDDVTFVRDNNRDAYFRVDALQSHISRKEHKIVLYTTKCADIKERDALLNLFKDSKHIYTCKTAIYRKADSSEKQLEIIFDAVDTVTCDEKFVDTLLSTVRKCQKMLSDYRKAQKAQ